MLRGVTLDVSEGTLSVLVGPSGVGKTTLLRTIAGLARVTRGVIELAGRDLSGVPPHRRRVALVFQEPRLFPNLSVIENVAFPLRMTGMGRPDRHCRAHALLDEVGLGHLAWRGPRGLSGGEQQRVAVARALAAEPDLLLLDEPLAAVDPNRREELRRLIRRLQWERRLTTLYVTHDRAEAAELGDEVALMLEGRIVQHDPPHELFERPNCVAVARFFGSNLLRGVVTAGRLRVGEAGIEVPGPDGEAAVAIRPERVRLDEHGRLRLRVDGAIYAGTHVRLKLRGDEIVLEAHVAPETAPPLGTWTHVHLPTEHVWRLPERLAAAPDGEGERREQ